MVGGLDEGVLVDGRDGDQGVLAGGDGGRAGPASSLPTLETLKVRKGFHRDDVDPVT
jgi:hypothetical protein